LNPPNYFLNRPNTLSNYVQGGLAESAIYYVRFTSQISFTPTVEKFNPQLIFHNSNTVC